MKASPFILPIFNGHHPEQARKPGLMLILSVVLLLSTSAQDHKRTYDVYRNGDPIGQMVMAQSSSGDDTHLSLQTEIKLRFLLLLTVSIKEETIYKNGVLAFSSINRKLNGKQKTNKQIILAGDRYNLVIEGDTRPSNNAAIRFNLLSMYCYEPDQVSRLYADNFDEYVPIQKTGIGIYKVTLPDGNYNIYHYSNGICDRIQVHHSLYTLDLVLKLSP